MSEFHDMAGNREKMNRLPKYMWLDRRHLCETSFQNVMVNKGPICVPGLFYKVLTSIIKFLPNNFAARQLARHDFAMPKPCRSMPAISNRSKYVRYGKTARPPA